MDAITPLHKPRFDGPIDLNHQDFINDDGVLVFIRTAGIYADPSWITALAWSKISGAPSSFTPTVHAASHTSVGSDPVTLTQSQVTGLTAALSGKADLASPTFTGTPTVPTATNVTSNTQAASTAFVHALITDLINASPATLDTLKELADAIGDDPNFATTVATSIATKLAKASNLSDLTDAAAARTNLGGTTVGKALFTLTNPGAISFLQVNADNSVTAQTASAQRTALGLVIGTNVQAWDTDLDIWATKSAPAGTVVGTSDTQSLTNKKLGSLTTNGFVKTGSGDGTLSIDTVTYLPLAGGTLVGNLLFTDNTYDIGASGATRPRNLYVANTGNFGGAIAAQAYNATSSGVTQLDLNISDAVATIGVLRKSQAANSLGGYLQFSGGNTGVTALGYVGFTHRGTGSDSIFTGETADSFAIRATNDLILGGGSVIGVTINASRTTFSKPAKLKNYTVATLPTGSEGDFAYVTDALTPAFLSTVVGGGTVRTPVFYNGSNWVGA